MIRTRHARTAVRIISRDPHWPEKPFAFVENVDAPQVKRWIRADNLEGDEMEIGRMISEAPVYS